MSGPSSRKAADNSLAADPQREHRVRERAYHLWETEGKPHGRDVEFWERARELIAIEENAGAAQLPNPMTHPETARETGVEEAKIQENLGEAPETAGRSGGPKADAHTEAKGKVADEEVLVAKPSSFHPRLAEADDVFDICLIVIHME